MSLFQALPGVQVELSRLSRPTDRIARLAGITRLFAEEIYGTLLLAPYGARSFALHRRLPAWDPAKPAGLVGDEPRIHRAVRYTPDGAPSPPRCTLDVYVPPGAAPGSESGVPCVLFCHGGVWAAGESWHYSPMASTLARLGVLTAVMQYSLYPDALVPAMVEEVGQALTWAMDNAAAYGADPQQLSLVGHSAGAQLCAMALLHRAAAAHAAADRTSRTSAAASAAAAAATNSPSTAGPAAGQGFNPSGGGAQSDIRMPRRFVGVAGVYDISKHYEYESDRGVQELSTMKRAIGGLTRAASVSPSVILATALHRARCGSSEGAHNSSGGGGNGDAATNSSSGRDQGSGVAAAEKSSSDASGAAAGAVEDDGSVLRRFYEEFPLAGEAIAHRIGFDRGSGHYDTREAALTELSLRGAEAVPALPLAAAAHLPPTVLVSSCTDLTVPWFESAEMFHRLVDSGVPAKHLVYNKVGHGDFVVQWPTSAPATPLPLPLLLASLQLLPPPTTPHY